MGLRYHFIIGNHKKDNFWTGQIGQLFIVSLAYDLTDIEGLKTCISDIPCSVCMNNSVCLLCKDI